MTAARTAGLSRAGPLPSAWPPPALAATAGRTGAHTSSPPVWSSVREHSGGSPSMWPRGPGGEQKPALLLTPGRTHHKPTRRRFTAHPLNAAQGRAGRARAGEHRSRFPSSEGRTLCHTPREVLLHRRNQRRQGRRRCTWEPAQQVQGVLVSVSKGLRESTARGLPSGHE